MADLWDDVEQLQPALFLPESSLAPRPAIELYVPIFTVVIQMA
jgi:hypothetical protein